MPPIAQFVHGAPLMVDYTPDEAIAAGSVVVVGNGCRIAHTDMEADRLGALALSGGVYDVAKATGGGNAFEAGDLVDFDAENDRAVEAGEGPFLGQVVNDADADAPTVRIAHYQPTPQPEVDSGGD